MFNVSQAYNSAIEKSMIKSRVSGTITLSTGGKIQLTDSDIVSGSLSIDNKCINDSEFCLGSVYIGQLMVTVFNNNVDRYSLYNAEVKFSYFLTLEDGTEEEIPLGVYYVVEATRTKKMIQLKCFDAMTFFDESIEEDTFGTAFQLMTLFCEKFGLTLATTEEEMNLMCNPQASLSLKAEKVGTYRDAVSYIASVMGGFATINRHGEMEIRQFHTTSDRTISARKRTKSTIHDYETYFNSVTIRFLAESNFYPYTEVVEGMNTGLKLDMGDNPMVFGVEDVKHEVLQNIMTYLQTIRYVPCSFTMVSDPSIDLGDGITIVDVNSTDESVFSIVTGISWTHHGGQTITSNGSDAFMMGVSSKVQKEIANVESSMSIKDITVKSYTNSETHSIGSSEKEIIRISYTGAIDDTVAIFLATIPVEMSHDGNLVLKYYIGAVYHSTVTKYLERGKHFVSMTNYFTSDANEAMNVRVCAYTEYFESDKRQNDAKIVSFMNYVQNQIYEETEIDTTVPTATILSATIRASIHAQGLLGTTPWDGTIEVADTVFGQIMTKLAVRTKVSDSAIVTTDYPDIHDIVDMVSSVQMMTLPFTTVNDSFTVGYVISSATRTIERPSEWTYDSKYINTGNNTFALKTIYSYMSQEGQIDSGRMCSVTIRTDDKAIVEGVVIENG